jgi:hypothetical protein
MSLSSLPPDLSAWFFLLAHLLDARQHDRCLLLLLGILFARGRRTVTTWLRASGLSPQFRSCYYLLSSLGRRSEEIARCLLLRVAVPLLVGNETRLFFGLDDTPTARYGPKVQGAGIHHNPTPGPAGEKFLYGHVWVTLAWLASHRRWGTIALPLLARLYIRQKDLPKVPAKHRPPFQTKLQQAAELLAWLVAWLGWLKKTLWLVVDGAYAKKELLRPARKLGVVVISRLRKDAALRSLPPTQRPTGKPGPLPTYGKQAISLAKRAGHKQGWQTEEFMLYRQQVTKTYKTFLATWPSAGGLIRVVLVQEERGWVAYFATDPEATVADILGAVAARGAIEQAFHDLKEVWGLGQQQVRNLWANIGVYHLNLWMHTLVELWAWRQSQRQLVSRGESPWDDRERRPSHADRRKALQRVCLDSAFQAAGHGRGQEGKFRCLARRLLKMASSC